MTPKGWPLAWRALLLAVLGVAGVFGLHSLHGPEWRETVGFIEFTPPVPAGRPPVLTLRLRLNPEDRAWYPRDRSIAEAGVVNGTGDRLFYVMSDLVPVGETVGATELLRTFASRNDLADHPDCHDVRTEFRDTPRGPVWVQRYTDLAPDRLANRLTRPQHHTASFDRLDVLRYADVRHGLVLELRFFLPPGGESRLEPFIWEMVQQMEVTDRPES
jgi:hypothetical protein